MQVGTSPLVAAIDGGDRTVGVSEPLTLDASASYDPDVPDGGALNTSWTCEAVAGAGACAGGLLDQAANELDLTPYGAGTYVFGVLVRKFADGEWRNATASVVIEVTFDVVPPVAIAALTVSKANPSLKLVLEATGGPAPYAFEYAWSLASGSLASGTLADSASTALAGAIDADAVATNYLVLPAGSLTAGGEYRRATAPSRPPPSRSTLAAARSRGTRSRRR